MANTRGYVYSKDGKQLAASGLGALEALFISLDHKPEFCEEHRAIAKRAIDLKDNHGLQLAISTIIQYATANPAITFEELRHNQFKPLSIVLSQNNNRTVVFSADTAANTKLSTIILAALDSSNMYMLKEIKPQHFQTHKASDTYYQLEVEDTFLETLFDAPIEPITPTLASEPIAEIAIGITPSPTESPEIKPIPNPSINSSASFTLSQSEQTLFSPRKAHTPPPPVKSFWEGCNIQ